MRLNIPSRCLPTDISRNNLLSTAERSYRFVVIAEGPAAASLWDVHPHVQSHSALTGEESSNTEALRTACHIHACNQVSGVGDNFSGEMHSGVSLRNLCLRYTSLYVSRLVSNAENQTYQIMTALPPKKIQIH